MLITKGGAGPLFPREHGNPVRQSLYDMHPPAMPMSGHGSAVEQAGSTGDASKALLPYGTSLHYQNCGCPPGWRSAGSPADVVDLLVKKAFQAYQAGRLVATRPLRVCYFLPHHNVTGGMKCLVEHVRLLKTRGKPPLVRGYEYATVCAAARTHNLPAFWTPSIPSAPTGV